MNEARQISILLDCVKSPHDTTFKGLEMYAKCVDIHDGDTCRLKFFYRNEITQCSVRLLGIDAPEIIPKKAGRTVESLKKEKNEAKKAKDELLLLFGDDRLVYVKFEEHDKYGRPLVTLYKSKNDARSINQIMIEKGYGVSYDGGHKKTFDEIH